MSKTPSEAVMKELQVNIPGYEYQLHIGQHILEPLLPEFLRRVKARHVVVVTNQTIHNLYPFLISQSLQATEIQVDTCILPDGEQYKTLETLALIYDFLLSKHANRNTVLIAFGGGVIGDMAGFAAATFMRGIRVVQVPTTLLAFVDSSIGGKTAVNHPLGKNTIGAFKQPSYVCTDLVFLKTLPFRELQAGYMELLKHGLIHDVELLDRIQTHSLEPLDLTFLEEAVYRSCQVKARVVELDEKESNLRATLNFGHTLGHLLETHTGYTQYLHGEAVGVGMFFAAFVSRQLDFLAQGDFEKVRSCLQPYLVSQPLPALNQERFQSLILHDKKAQDQTVNFILLKQRGECFIYPNMSPTRLWTLFGEFQKAYPRVFK
ncbi:3-dehydroquinate synthase [Deltaproteobacteria bacterium TL4]